MLYLDYAKQTENGYIMNFFANSVEDLEDISEGKEFVTKNGTNYGVPAPQSVVTITNKDGEKTTYLMGEDGNWIPGVVNPTDYYTKKQADEKFAGKEEVEAISQDVSTLDGQVAQIETSLSNKQDKITKTTSLSCRKIKTDSLSFTMELGSDSNEYDYGLLFASKNVVSTGQLKPSFVDENFFEWVLPPKSGTLATTDDIAKIYKHKIAYTNINGDIFGYSTFYSSNNLQCGSLTDLKTLLGDNFNIAVYPISDYLINNWIPLSLDNSHMMILDITGETANTNVLGYNAFTITDTVTTI